METQKIHFTWRCVLEFGFSKRYVISCVFIGTSEDNDETTTMPVPQVKVAPDGSIIIDEASTMIETTAAKKAKEDLLKSPLVFESANQPTNYGSWGKKKKNADWSDKDTIKFYKALSVFGTDFSLMEGVFKKRSRHELKMKFKKVR